MLKQEHAELLASRFERMGAVIDELVASEQGYAIRVRGARGFTAIRNWSEATSFLHRLESGQWQRDNR